MRRSVFRSQFYIGEAETQDSVGGSEAAEVGLDFSTGSPFAKLGTVNVDAETGCKSLQLGVRDGVEVFAEVLVPLFVVGNHVVLAADDGVGLPAVEVEVVANETIEFECLSGVLR